ncbi:MAG: hypothetical protein H3Z53_01440 [archaeon]|nr:hypothetical protein [archaeon]MCP8313023.1 hypothetical protein [archaeon]MCP8317584.1 hypothetical protein [archaeon]
MLQHKNMMKNPPLIEGEKIVKRVTACISIGLHPNSWKPINLILTNKRLLFCQPSIRVIVEISLDKVRDIWIKEKDDLHNHGKRALVRCCH